MAGGQQADWGSLYQHYSNDRKMLLLGMGFRCLCQSSKYAHCSAAIFIKPKFDVP